MSASVPSFNHLPGFIVTEIFSYLDVQTLCSLQFTCHTWHFLMLPLVWRWKLYDFDWEEFCKTDSGIGASTKILNNYGRFVKKFSRALPVHALHKVIQYCPNLVHSGFRLEYNNDLSVISDFLVNFAKRIYSVEIVFEENSFWWSIEKSMTWLQNITVLILDLKFEDELLSAFSFSGLKSPVLNRLTLKVDFFDHSFFLSLPGRFPNISYLFVAGKLDFTTVTKASFQLFPKLKGLSLELYSDENLDPTSVLGPSSNFSGLGLLDISIRSSFNEELLSEYIFSQPWFHLRTLSLGIWDTAMVQHPDSFLLLSSLQLDFYDESYTIIIPELLRRLNKLKKVAFSGQLSDSIFNCENSSKTIQNLSLSGTLTLSNHFIEWLSTQLPSLQTLVLFSLFSIGYSVKFEPDNFKYIQFANLLLARLPSTDKLFSKWLREKSPELFEIETYIPPF